MKSESQRNVACKECQIEKTSCITPDRNVTRYLKTDLDDQTRRRENELEEAVYYILFLDIQSTLVKLYVHIPVYCEYHSLHTRICLW
jgi:hypothetical protein